MAIQLIKGNIFTSESQTLVNAVNTVGVMGAGVALEFRLRYPAMYTRYVELCRNKQFEIGQLWLFKNDKRWILNFPTKEHWKDESKIAYLEISLQKFVETYIDKGIKSIAFPILGAGNGRISEDESLSIMQYYLEPIDIKVEIYKYDPYASDDLFPKIKEAFLNCKIEDFMLRTKIKKQYIQILIDVFNNNEINSISGLINVEGLGIKTIEKIIYFSSNL